MSPQPAAPPPVTRPTRRPATPAAIGRQSKAAPEGDAAGRAPVDRVDRDAEARAGKPTNDRQQRPVVERRPDYGNIVHVDCRKCGTSNLLDPKRMENHKVGVFLLCCQCGQRFLVRRTDIDRPAPDAVTASLYTSAPSPRTRRRRLGRRS